MASFAICFFRLTRDAGRPGQHPHLFDFRDYRFIHWDGNTTSVMDRNIAQAIALGADFDKTTFKSTVLPRNLHRLETIALKIRPPKWPEEVLGNIDRAKAARASRTPAPLPRVPHSENVYPADKVGTSPLRAANLGRWSPTCRSRNSWPPSPPRPNSCPTRTMASRPRKPKDGAHGQPRVALHRRLHRASLAGAWATAPFLHNGSVPTLFDLLQPQARRPARFPVGHREYDPVKVGFTTGHKSPVWTFDTQLKGNANSGHEYGAGLSEDEKWELIEYLKTL